MKSRKLVVVPSLGGGSPEARQLFWRTLLLKDTTIGNDIADRVTAQRAGTAKRFVGVLRKPIGSSLTVRVAASGTLLATLTIPASTPLNTAVVTTTFPGGGAIALDAPFTWDITASDEQTDINGIASFTIYWESNAA